jgi:predicted nucleic acid-binding protein
MIVVDTSVWVAALRSAKGPEAVALAALLDADEVALPTPVRLELLSGVARKDYPKLHRALSALPVVAPTDETWRTMEGWLERAVRAGERFGFGDCLIAVLAREIDALVWSLDADFKRLQRLKLVDLYEPA